MRRVIVAAFALVCAASAFAQDYPNHTIRIIVPTPAGGPVDTMARLIASALPAELKQATYVENRPGAGNTIGSRLAAAAEPDGYTLMVSAASGLIMSPMIHKNAGYDAASFAPVMLIAETPQVLVVNPKLPVKSLADLVALAKAGPGKLNYSTGGAGTLPHLSAELFKRLTGTDIVHVPYKGGAPALIAVVAGDTQLTFDTLGTSLQLIRDGKLRALAVGAPKRVAELPDVPTMAEAGLPALTTGAWTALMAPRATPPAIIAKLNAAANAALHSERMQATLAKIGAQPRGGSPADLAAHIERETKKWAPFVAALNLRVD
jgi:tripartite-type tricarboxylate transporter receptor subunit TctC